MRSEERLRRSYEKQLETFNLAKQKKLNNISTRKFEVEQKLRKLQTELDKVEKAYQEELEREFLTFREFQEEAQLRSQQSREKKTS